MALFGGPRAIWIEPAGDEIADGVAALLDAAGDRKRGDRASAARCARPPGCSSWPKRTPMPRRCTSYVPEGRDADQMVIAAGTRRGTADRVRRRRAACRGVRQQPGDRRAGGGEVRAVPRRRARPSARPRRMTSIDLLGADSAEGDLMRLGDLALAGDGRALIEELERAAITPGEAIPAVRALQRRLVQIAPLRARVERGERVDGVMTSMGKALFWKDKAADAAAAVEVERRARLPRRWSAARRSNGPRCFPTSRRSPRIGRGIAGHRPRRGPTALARRLDRLAAQPLADHVELVEA